MQLDTSPFDASENTNDKYHKTIKLPPLPNGAISDILLQTKFHCPKAQVWMRAENVSEGTKQRWLEKTKNGRVQGLDRRKQGHLKMTVSLMLVQRTSAERQAELNHLAQRLRKAHLDQDQCVVSTPEDLGTGLKRLTTGWKVNRWKRNGRRGICRGSSELREPMTILIEYWDLSTRPVLFG